MNSSAISKQHSFTFKNKTCFINFVDMTEEQAEKILQWRNHPDIRKWMYQQNPIQKEDHFRYLAGLENQSQKFYWLVGEEDRPLGVINLQPDAFGRAEWGFYLNPDYFGSSFGIHLVYHALNFFFHTLKIKELYGFVRTDNHNALRLHDLFEIHEDTMKERATQQGPQWFYRRSIGQQEWLKRGWVLGDVKERLMGGRD